MRTVVFGPFFGEFGWELYRWKSWVSKVCQGRFASYRKIAASFPGREALYPYVDEYWAHPEEVASLQISNRGYITDYWSRDWPKGSRYVTKSEGGYERDTTGVDHAIESDDFARDISKYAFELLGEYRSQLPEETIFFSPHVLNFYEEEGEKLVFGTAFKESIDFEGDPLGLSELVKFAIPLAHQVFEPVRPTERGLSYFHEVRKTDRPIVAVHPRHRPMRRPDRNWPRENYDQLILDLQRTYPEYQVAVFGSPEGCYYGDGVPKDCLDFVNLPLDVRTDAQAALLNEARLAIGGSSGGLMFSLLAACPTLMWGWGRSAGSTYASNMLDVPLVYWPVNQPSVETIFDLAGKMLSGETSLVSYPSGYTPSECQWADIDTQPRYQEPWNYLDQFPSLEHEVWFKQYLQSVAAGKAQEGAYLPDQG